MPVGGPVKGSVIVGKNAHIYFYVERWGFRVEDPCKAVDNNMPIRLASG